MAWQAYTTWAFLRARWRVVSCLNVSCCWGSVSWSYRCTELNTELLCEKTKLSQFEYAHIESIRFNLAFSSQNDFYACLLISAWQARPTRAPQSKHETAADLLLKHILAVTFPMNRADGQTDPELLPASSSLFFVSPGDSSLIWSEK